MSLNCPCSLSCFIYKYIQTTIPFTSNPKFSQSEASKKLSFAFQESALRSVNTKTMRFRLPRIVNAKRIVRALTDVPKGYFPVYVGENQKRFVIPVSYLNNSLFQDLLSLSEEEFGYDHPSGALRIPCGEDVFVDLTSCLNGPRGH